MRRAGLIAQLSFSTLLLAQACSGGSALDQEVPTASPIKLTSFAMRRGTVAGAKAPGGDSPPADIVYAQPGTLVDVNGFRLNLYCMGSGSPAVVFDAGWGDWSPAWSKVQPEVAKWTRACSYDRAGTGFSDPGPMPRTSVRIAEELRTALHNAGVNGAYILVGSAFGGDNVRTFADMYMDEVAGLVLDDADPTDVEPKSMREDEHRGHAEIPRKLRDCRNAIAGHKRLPAQDSGSGQARETCAQQFFFRGLPEAEWSPELNAKVLQIAQTKLAMYDAYSSEMEQTAWDEAYLQQHRRSYGSRPIRVLTSGNHGVGHLGKKPPDTPEHLKYEQETTAAQARWLTLSRNSKQIFARNSSEYIQFDEPSTLINAIHDVFDEAVRNHAAHPQRAPGQSSSACPECPSMVVTTAHRMNTSSPTRPQTQPPGPALTRTDEMLNAWNAIGNKLVAMAQDFPEEDYDFKLQKDERTFALNLLHAAALDFILIRRISGSNVGPDFGEGDNPTRDQFKTKTDVVKFVQEAIADGAKVIQEQGDAGLDKTTNFFGNRLAHNAHIWTFAIEHSGEHYGQLVVYYRANNLVPPDSRRNAQASQLTSGSVFRDCPDCPEMVVLPAGSFTMGSSAEEKSWAASHGGNRYAVADEAPQHRVSVPAFALSKYDVTRGEYAAFARETGYPAGDGCGRGRAIFKWEKDSQLTWKNPGHAQTDDYPVVCVSWQDARAYITWLNRKARRGGAASAHAIYRLPSEAEWEYAARAGTTTKFYWGDDDAAAPLHAWFNANSGCQKVEGLSCDGGQAHPVGTKPPNPFGLYDTAGNVWQWTEDCYDNSYAGIPTDGRANEVPSSDPKAKDGQGNCLRVDRGGSWMFPAWLLRPATRERNPADYRNDIMGFRVAKTLP